MLLIALIVSCGPLVWRGLATAVSLAAWGALVWYYLFDPADRGELLRILKVRPGPDARPG